MLSRFYPSEYTNSTYNINFEQLYKEGYRGLLFDIDNTLVEHGSPADKRALELFKRLKKIGFKVCLISNNKKERVDNFNRDIQVFSIHKAGKPNGKSYLKAMKLMNTNIKNTVFVGDQIFTDIFGANRIGLKTYLVKPINKREEIQIILKRYPEKIVLFFYRLSLKKK